MVSCRIRPLSRKERAEGSDVVAEPSDDLRGVILHEADKDRPFGFHRTFGPMETQLDVFRSLGESLVNAVMSGENAAAIAYGQTGSGKTFTMLGPPLPGTGRPDYSGPERGLAPRVCELIFAAIPELGERFDVSVGVTFLEIYNEAVFDLLLPRKKKVKIRLMEEAAWVPSTVVPCDSAAKVMAVFDRGLRNRATSSTAANETSSRSHAIMQIVVRTVDLATRRETESMLQLVDLAGSEAVADTEATGARLEEAKRINTSLMALSEVCKALALPKRKRPVVPYRNSALTTILRGSFGGNSRTAIVINISPAASAMTTSRRSLRFGSSAAMVKNKPRVNRRVDYGAMRDTLERLQTDIAGQQIQLRSYKTMLKKLARAAAVSLAAEGVDSRRLAELYARYPVLRILSPGAVMTRYLPKGVILRFLTFAGSEATGRMAMASSSMNRVVQDERLWRVHCQQEIPGFAEADLKAPLADLEVRALRATGATVEEEEEEPRRCRAEREDGAAAEEEEGKADEGAAGEAAAAGAAERKARTHRAHFFRFAQERRELLAAQTTNMATVELERRIGGAGGVMLMRPKRR